ncbi:hypothetical protein MP638_000448 [Amoeboaphelidium occidentale]|nr:hypothetical protein MP638_000448 [Amoeboaphelidium occidentale]
MSYLAWQANERADKPEFPLVLDTFLARNNDFRVVVLAALLTARVELYSQTYASDYSLSKEFIKKNWYKYFPLLFHILSYFNEHSTADAQGRLLERRRGRGLRTFTLVPLTKMRNGFVLVDTTLLGEILAFASARGRNRVPKSFPGKLGIIQRNQTILRNQGKYWKDVMKIDKLSNSSKKFSFSINTDGVSARVHYKKTCYTSDLGRDGFKIFGDKEYVPLDVENRRKVGLDPGRKDMFSCHDGSKKSYHCSGKEWRVISGAKSSKQKRDLWISKRDDIQTIKSGMPSAKLYWKIIHVCLLFYGSLKWRQLRRKIDIRRQKAYDVLCKRIAGEKLDSIVAYGSAKFSGSSRGSPPIPTTHLYKKLLEKKVCVRLVWEHWTSVVCSVCHNDLPKGKK